MSKSFRQLDDVHVDVLSEVGNIGASHAATALAKMLGKRIAVSVPSVRMVDFKDIADFVGGGETILIGILINISGDIDGMMMFIVKTGTAHTLITMLMGGMSQTEIENEFSEMEQSAMQEIGNILCSSYLGALAGLINIKIIPSVPYLAIDMANAILSVPAIEFGKVADQALFIESVFTADGSDVSGFFLLVPDMPSFDRILSTLGVT